MSALYQRLRELGPEAFEELCFQIITERHPGRNIKRVCGVGGDKGVDIFEGDLSGRPTIWQCKYFVNGIRSPQKKQIKKSLRVALQNFEVKRWILCVPVDLDTNSHAWFQGIKNEYDNRCETGLFQASQIVRELLHRRTLRNAFFPGAVIDTSELRSLLAGTGDYTPREIEKLALENVEQYLQRLRDRDARFDYQITYLPERPLPLENRGQVLTITQEGRRLDVFPRDIEALKLDPPQLNFTLSPSASEKLRKSIETGRPAEFGPGEVSSFQAWFDFLLPEGTQLNDTMMVIQPFEKLKERKFVFRVTFGSESNSVCYPFLEFGVERAGTLESVLSTTDASLAFRLSIVLEMPPGGLSTGVPVRGTFNTVHQFPGRPIREVKKFIDAMRSLRASGEIELYDLRQDRRFFEAKINLDEVPRERLEFDEIIDELAEVSDKLGTELRLPESLKLEEIENLPVLLELIRTGFVKLPVTKLSATVIKDPDHQNHVLELFKGANTFRVDFKNHSIQLLGAPVDIGPCSLVLEGAVVANPEKTRKEYLSASAGEGIVFEMVPTTEVTLLAPRFSKTTIDSKG